MHPRARRAAAVAGAVVHELRTERITFMAGSIAYHAFVSLLPLLLLLLAVASRLGGSGLEQDLIDLARAALTPGAAEALVTELRTASPSLSAVGLAVLVWGTLRIFRGIDTAFSDIYESEAENTLLDQFVDGVVVFGCIAVAILLASLLDSLLPAADAGPVAYLLQRAALAFGLAVALAPMFYVFPDEPGMQAREILPGVAFTAVGLTVFESLFRLYLRVSSQQPRRSLLAAILVFLTWLYVSSLVLLVGVALNAVLSNRSSDVAVRPVLGGERLRPDVAAARAERTPVDRDALSGSLADVSERLAAAESVVLEVDGERVAVPPPDVVEAETAGGSALPLSLGASPLGLTLRWSRFEE